jgi:LacI family transcriptional regulator
MARVTVQAIADELGISKFAVSRALSGKGGVSDETRAAVVELAHRVGYRPRPRASNATRITLLYGDPDTAQREQWITVQAGIYREAERCGAELAVVWATTAATIDQVLERSSGTFLVGPHDDDVLRSVLSAGLPCVCLGGDLPPLTPVDAIDGADAEGAAALAEHVAELGHRELVYVHGKLGYPGRLLRLQSVQQLMRRFPDGDVREMSFSEDNAADDFRNEIMRLWREGYAPTAFLCGNDYVAITVLTGLMRLGLRVPDDVSVVGYADYPVASQTSPPLTTVKVPFREIGMAALRLLVSRIGLAASFSDLPPQRVGLIPQLVLRQSTAAPGDKVARRSERAVSALSEN